ncbi:MAG TPA: hypothetical protein VK934_05295 [Fimbriimonas sp.]|nr:hypothetical protein [Fimbriimonas sp.]
MKLRFLPGQPVLIWAHMFGPGGDRYLKLMLDTGVATTMVRVDALHQLGIDLDRKEGCL